MLLKSAKTLKHLHQSVNQREMLETWTTAIAVHNNQKAPWREQQYSSRVEVDICKIKDDLSEMEGTLGD